MKSILLYGLLAVGGYLAYKQYDISRKRQWIKDFSGNDPAFHTIIDRMTNQEVEDVYEFLTKYAPITGDVPRGTMPPSLQLEIQKISTKYNIFT